MNLLILRLLSAFSLSLNQMIANRILHSPSCADCVAVDDFHAEIKCFGVHR
jgi:CBS-domain-containing membrane protein